MKMSERWLREWCNPSLSTEELCEQLTLLGLEIEGVEPAAPTFSGVVVARVESVAPHPNADKLRVCQVNDGQNTVQVVCGASNVRVGLIVPFATVGAELPGGSTIKAAKLRGVESAGMLCSAKELGLNDATQGLMELDADAPVGQPIREFLQLDDVIIELKVTPNRGDCLSILGVARELAARNQLPLPEQGTTTIEISHQTSLPIRIEVPAACCRYAGRVVQGINPAARAPLWMRERLRRAGIRSLSAAVDITNYVMLELGQPMHAFDLDTLQGQQIRVRYATEGERLLALNGDELSLDTQTLVIADVARPVALAGVMGGEATAVSDQTQNIFLESACFMPRAMAGTARRYKLHTDSSHRFERGVDPELALRALDRATALLVSIAGGKAGAVTVEGSAPTLAPIRLRHVRIENLLGYSLDTKTVESLLRRLGMVVVSVGFAEWQVTPPSHRYDLALEVDLIEEIARLVGYDQLPKVNATAVIPRNDRPEGQLAPRRLADLLMTRGYSEAVTYSFTDGQLEQLLGAQAEGIALDNPIAANLSQMRTTVLSGLLPALQYNLQRQQTRVRLFEIGPTFTREGDTIRETQRVAGVITGAALPEQWGSEARDSDFFDLKADVEALIASAGTASRWQIRSGGPNRLHPGQSAELLFDDNVVGYLGRLHPELSSALDLRQAPLVFEIDMKALTTARIPASKPVSEFPSVRRDLAILLPEMIRYDQINNAIQSVNIDYLSDFSLFDIYLGKGLPSGYKSMAITLSFQDKSRTLEEGDVERAMAQIRTQLQGRLGAQFRE